MINMITKEGYELINNHKLINNHYEKLLYLWIEYKKDCDKQNYRKPTIEDFFDWLVYKNKMKDIDTGNFWANLQYRSD